MKGLPHPSQHSAPSPNPVVQHSQPDPGGSAHDHPQYLPSLKTPRTTRSNLPHYRVGSGPEFSQPSSTPLSCVVLGKSLLCASVSSSWPWDTNGACTQGCLPQYEVMHPWHRAPRVPHGKWVASLPATAVASAIPSLLRGAVSGPSDLPRACLPWSARQRTSGGTTSSPPAAWPSPGAGHMGRSTNLLNGSQALAWQEIPEAAGPLPAKAWCR